MITEQLDDLDLRRADIEHALRQRLSGVNKAQVARRMGSTRQAVAAWHHGQRTVSDDWLKRLEQAVVDGENI